MCLNQILFDEQIALIGCNTLGNPVQMRRHRQQLADASRLLRAYPYPHRPYDPSGRSSADKAGQMPRAAATPSLQTGTR
ncbi:hypothetical protein EDF57_1207 [Novosphingobium sp. PhB55]|uniref:hypothetical protein n=1 Tax=Novosphingobium sp. PhB55 TaxID=2485106 RepID=UPI0010650079|nr:hypothetical protein [Novosphingobium sp. PhB55]TDW58633.1 hypothetical protein EDF57_1207 [Novosphingobium sp. PhB55]